MSTQTKGISLHIGLNRVDPAHYKGWDGALQGCENDANDLRAIAEAAAMVRAADLPPDRVLAALSGGRADSALLQEFFLKFAEMDLTPTGRVSNMVKDLETARDYARSANIPLPVTSAVSELHRWLATAGHGEADNAALMLYYDVVK